MNLKARQLNRRQLLKLTGVAGADVAGASAGFYSPGTVTHQS